MGFQSLAFLVLLALTAVLCPLAAKKDRRAGTALAMLFSGFYPWGLKDRALLGFNILLIGGAVTFGAARYWLSGKAEARRRTVLMLAAVWHIAVLLGFKYLGFFTGGAVSLGWAPLGLSFFTFQQLCF